MQTFVPLQRVKLLSFVLAVLLFVVGVVAASAQPVRIAVGATVRGPAIIELPFTTTLIPPEHKVTVDPFMNLVLEVP